MCAMINLDRKSSTVTIFVDKQDSNVTRVHLQNDSEDWLVSAAVRQILWDVIPAFLIPFGVTCNILALAVVVAPGFEKNDSSFAIMCPSCRRLHGVTNR